MRTAATTGKGGDITLIENLNAVGVTIGLEEQVWRTVQDFFVKREQKTAMLQKIIEQAGDDVPVFKGT